MKKQKIIKSPIVLIISVILGSIIGLIFKKNILFLKPFGTIFLNLMFTIVVPLVFFTISSSIANMINLKRLGKILKYLFIVFLITSFISSIFALIIVKIINPLGNNNIILKTTETLSTLNLSDKIVDMFTVTDFGNLLNRSNMLPLIIFSILFGISTSLVTKQDKTITKILETLSEIMLKLVSIIMYYAPIGLFAYFASLAGEYGSNILSGYMRSFILYLIMSILYYLIFYTLYSYIAEGKKGVKKFYQNILPPTLTSLGTQSSLATLPTNMVACEKIGIKKDIYEVTTSIGSTMHMEGSSMGAILKIAFLFAIFNKPFTGIDTYLIALVVSVLSEVVMSGIPGGGLIGEMLIVSLYNFPASAFPLISTIGILIDAPATTLNVIGDTTSAMLISKYVEEDSSKEN